MKLAEREREILVVLNSLSGSVESFVVVGGYAVSALARHRFSVDCDLVVRERDVGRIETVLESYGFSKVQEHAGFDKAYSGRFVRYAKKVGGLPVSVDLMVGSLVSRDTDGSWSFDYVSSHSVEATVRGVEASVKCRIPERELLLAFKLHSARLADVRDVVMLSETADWDEVIAHLNRGNLAKLRTSLNRVLGDLDDPRLANSLKAEFSTKQDVKSEVAKTRDKVKLIVSKLEVDTSPRNRQAARVKRSYFGEARGAGPFTEDDETDGHEL